MLHDARSQRLQRAPQRVLALCIAEPSAEHLNLGQPRQNMRMASPADNGFISGSVWITRFDFPNNLLQATHIMVWASSHRQGKGNCDDTREATIWNSEI